MAIAKEAERMERMEIREPQSAIFADLGAVYILLGKIRAYRKLDVAGQLEYAISIPFFSASNILDQLNPFAV